MKKAKKIKYGLYCYDTKNIGDEIQSVAAKRFLPRVDYYINRDHIDTTIPKANEEIKLIMNGWYIERSTKDNKIHWPPKNPSLNPLLVSVHVSFLNGSTEIFNTPRSRAFLQKYSPIGARDYATQKFFESINVPSYFSGCLTLTLLPDEKVKKSDFILAVDVDSKVLQSIKDRSSREVISINTVHNGNYTIEERFDLAKYWLSLYQSAHCIITPRLHAMLPGLAFNTPVIALSGRDTERYSGLMNLVNHFTPKEFIQNTHISVDNPSDNPSTFLPIRDSLVHTCSEFTGFDSKSSYMEGSTVQELLNKPTFRNIIVKSVEEAFTENSFRIGHEKELARLYGEVNYLKTLLKEKDLQIEAITNPSVKSASKTLIESIKKNCFKTKST